MIPKTNSQPVPNLEQTPKHRAEQTPDVPTWRRVVAAGAAAAVGALGAVHVHNDEAQDEHMTHQLAETQETNDRLSRIVAAENGVDTETVKGTNLKQVEELEGHGLRVSPEKRAELKKSVVKIGMMPKSTTTTKYWGASCTGTKIRVNGSVRVLTAAHCINTQSEEWSTFTGDPSLPTPKVVNVTGVAQNEFGIFGESDLADDVMDPDSKPHAEVTAISKDIVGFADAALLAINESGNDELDNQPPIELTQFAHAKPKLGQEVALYSVPGASGNQPVAATGIYLGRSDLGTGLSREVDYVGIMVNSAGEDACNFGASGSLAVFAEGGYTGPLSTRNNLGYDGNPALSQKPDSPTDTNIEYRLSLEQELGVDISKFDTVCGFSVLRPDTIQALDEELTDPTPTNKLPKQVSYK